MREIEVLPALRLLFLKLFTISAGVLLFSFIIMFFVCVKADEDIKKIEAIINDMKLRN